MICILSGIYYSAFFVLFQNASRLLEDDIKNSRLPGAILFSGNPATGKLTTALETLYAENIIFPK